VEVSNDSNFSINDRTYVSASSDEIKFFACTPSACLDLNRDQVLTEITSCGVNEEALATRIFDRNGRESSSCCVVARIGLGCGRGLENTSGS
jgi:hypothetical protein